MRHVINVNFTKMHNLSLYSKHENAQNGEMWNDENAKTCKNSPSDPPHVIFGLKTGSRGTPWNSKSAGPGGSDFAKCQFWSFIWHFGHFGGVSIFDTFLTLFHFSIFIILLIFDFLLFVTFDDFWILSILVFSCFDDFCQFLINFCCWHHFWSIFVSNLGASIMTHFSSSKPALPTIPILVVKFHLIFVL